VYPEGKQFGSALSLAAAFCRSRPLVRPFAADGSKVHELEHDAGGVNTVVIAKVEIVFVEVVYTVVAVAAASLMFASTLFRGQRSSPKGIEWAGPREKGQFMYGESVSSPSPTA
jgi:hypothetical protein